MPNNFTWKEIKLDCWLVCKSNTALIATLAASEVLQSAGRVGELYGHIISSFSAVKSKVPECCSVLNTMTMSI